MLLIQKIRLMENHKYLSVLDNIFSTAVADNNGFGIDVSGKDLKSIFMK